MDEMATNALNVLFEKFWIIRDQEPDMYRTIRDREMVLKRHLQDKYGLELIVHRYFAKLEKIPVEPQSWMGIQTFEKTTDYVLFCCILAFLERKRVDEQFLLSDLTEYVAETYPGFEKIEWSVYTIRQSLIRAMREVISFSLIRTIDGHLEGYQSDTTEDVLYEVTIYAKYFMRAYPDDLTRFRDEHELLEQEWKRRPEDMTRRRVYRALRMTPFVRRKGEDDLDFQYIRRYRDRLQDDFLETTPFRLEVYRDVAFLNLPEPKTMYTYYPGRGSIHDVSLHVTAMLMETLDNQELVLGHLDLPFSRFKRLLYQTKERYGHGWSKDYREGSIAHITKEVLRLWKNWELATVDEAEEMIHVFPGISRVIARYPKDYEEKRERRNE